MAKRLVAIGNNTDMDGDGKADLVAGNWGDQ
jgi:hypothetical protein